jgi:hypothetical protein
VTVVEPSAALLRRAADHVQFLADDAGPGWNVYPEDGVTTPTFAWIALLNPAIGAPLAAWLRAEASDSDVEERDGDVHQFSGRRTALALARTLLGHDGADPVAARSAREQVDR